MDRRAGQSRPSGDSFMGTLQLSAEPQLFLGVVAEGLAELLAHAHQTQTDSVL